LTFSFGSGNFIPENSGFNKNRFLEDFKMIKKLFFHICGFGLILGGWFICVINVGLDRGATPFRFFSIPNLIGLTFILVGAYFPEIATKFFGKSEAK
jgi:hypothetical protein